MQSGAVLVSDVLLSVDIPVVSDTDCDVAYGGNATSPKVYPSMMCAGNDRILLLEKLFNLAKRKHEN